LWKINQSFRIYPATIGRHWLSKNRTGIIAARIQQLKVGEDLVVFETVWHDPEVEDCIAHGETGLVIEGFQATLNGIEGHYDAWRPDTKT
jgi:hypothetical protein